MTPSFQSCRVHKLVEFIKSAGFGLETDELDEQDLQKLLQEDYDIYIQLTSSEEESLRRELHVLASFNEMREAQIKGRELFPEDKGVEFVRTPSKDGLCSDDAWPVFYCYPLDDTLKLVPLCRPKSETNANARIDHRDSTWEIWSDRIGLFKWRSRAMKALWQRPLFNRGFFSSTERSPPQGV